MNGAIMTRFGVVAALLLASCGGEVGYDEQVRAILPPLSVECTEHEDCLPATLGYATCREYRCTFRCDSPAENALECVERGGTCRDYGDGNEFCSVL